MQTAEQVNQIQKEGNIAVIDIGISTQQIVVLNPYKPKEPHSYQRLFFPLTKSIHGLDKHFKSLFRSYADYRIRKFIISISAAPVFSSAKDAVETILNIINQYISPQRILCFSNDSKFVSVNEAKTNPTSVVSTGWRSLGEVLGELVEKDALVIEFSTRTTQITPVKDGKIVSSSASNYDRVRNGELLFYGFLETNISHIQNKFEFNNEVFFLPYELHAKAADILLITEDIQPYQYICDTPDELFKTKEEAMNRLRKVFNITDPSYDEQKLKIIAEVLKTHLLDQIEIQIKTKLTEYNLQNVVITGLGASILSHHLKSKGLNAKIIESVNKLPNTEICPAYCIAYLYSKKLISNG